MKLIKCYINNFGKLNNFSYEFNKELNVINQHNGFGKSTLCGFIKAMFYGFNSTKTKNLNDNERLRFLPWQGGVFGGFLDFETGENKYRIERTFGDKPSLDKFSLINLKTGKESFDYSERIGEELFGIDLKGFERCTFFSNNSLNLKLPLSISSKLSSLIDNTDDFSDYDSALNLLLKKSRQYKTVGGKGIIFDTESKLSKLQNKLFEVENAEKELNLKQEELESLKKKKGYNDKDIENIQLTISENAEISVMKQKIKHYNSLVSETKKAKETKEFIEKKYNSNIPDSVKVAELSDECGKLKNLKENTKFGLADKIFLFFSLLVFIFGFSCFAVCLVLNKSFIINLLISLLGAVFTLLFSAVFLSRRKKYKKLLLQVEQDFSFLGIKTDDYCLKLDEIRKDIFEYKLVSKNFEEYFNEAKNYYNSENLKSFKENIRSKTFEELKEREKELINISFNLSSEIIEVSSKVNQLHETADCKIDVLNQVERLNTELLEYKENYNVIIAAAEFLKQAKENFAVKYKEKIEESFKKNLNSLIGSSDEIGINSDFDVFVINNGTIKNIDSLSSGTKSAVEIAMRFSLIDTLFETEKPFIIFDDTFLHLDDNAFKNIAEKIKIISKDTQILYFTCSKSRTF